MSSRRLVRATNSLRRASDPNIVAAGRRPSAFARSRHRHNRCGSGRPCGARPEQRSRRPASRRCYRYPGERRAVRHRPRRTGRSRLRARASKCAGGLRCLRPVMNYSLSTIAPLDNQRRLRCQRSSDARSPKRLPPGRCLGAICLRTLTAGTRSSATPWPAAARWPRFASSPRHRNLAVRKTAMNDYLLRQNPIGIRLKG